MVLVVLCLTSVSFIYSNFINCFYYYAYILVVDNICMLYSSVVSNACILHILVINDICMLYVLFRNSIEDI